MPLRVSFNIWGVRDVILRKCLAGEKNSLELIARYLKLLEDVFKITNKIDFEVKEIVEYFQSRALVTRDLGQLVEKEKLIKNGINSKSENKITLAKDLGNATAFYGKNGDLNKMQKCLNRLENIYSETKNGDVLIEFAKAISNAIFDYGKKGEFNKMQHYLDRLKKLYDETKNGDVLVVFSEALTSAAICYGMNKNFNKMQNCLNMLEKFNKNININMLNELIIISAIALDANEPNLILRAYSLIHTCFCKPSEDFSDIFEVVKQNLRDTVAKLVEKEPELIDKISKYDNAVILLNEIYDGVRSKEVKRKIIDVLRSM